MPGVPDLIGKPTRSLVLIGRGCSVFTRRNSKSPCLSVMYHPMSVSDARFILITSRCHIGDHPLLGEDLLDRLVAGPELKLQPPRVLCSWDDFSLEVRDETSFRLHPWMHIHAKTCQPFLNQDMQSRNRISLVARVLYPPDTAPRAGGSSPYPAPSPPSSRRSRAVRR